MRVAKIEPRHTFSIYLPTSLYQKVVDKAGKGKVSTFIKEVLEEKLTKEEQQKKKEFQQKLIADYQSVAKSKKAQKEAEI
jgi:metal-responsive CopG/Arc/MetJ family transcriptional regulator